MVLKFKTNIREIADVQIISPYLEDDFAITFWHVDTDHPNKVLTVEGVNVNQEEIVEIARKAGYTISLIN